MTYKEQYEDLKQFVKGSDVIFEAEKTNKYLKTTIIVEIVESINRRDRELYTSLDYSDIDKIADEIIKEL